MVETSLRVEVKSPVTVHTHTVIFLHGRDSNATEFANEFFESQASDKRTFPEIFPGIKWVFPSSKMRLAERFGCELSQWFDIWSVEEPDTRPDLQAVGLSESMTSIQELIDKEATEVPLENIILAGISQGCVTAICTLLNNNTMRLAGFVGLCGWESRLLKESIEISTETRFTPVFLSHSKDDDVVPVGNGARLKDALEDLGMSVEWHCYEDGGHWINEPGGVDNMVTFISKVTDN